MTLGKFFPQIVDEDAAHMDTTLLTRVLLLRLSFEIGWGRFTAAKIFVLRFKTTQASETRNYRYNDPWLWCIDACKQGTLTVGERSVPLTSLY